MSQWGQLVHSTYQVYVVDHTHWCSAVWARLSSLLHQWAVLPCWLLLSSGSQCPLDHCVFKTELCSFQGYANILIQIKGRSTLLCSQITFRGISTTLYTVYTCTFCSHFFVSTNKTPLPSFQLIHLQLIFFTQFGKDFYFMRIKMINWTVHTAIYCAIP